MLPVHPIGPFKYGILRGRESFILWVYELDKYFSDIRLKDTLTDENSDDLRKAEALKKIRLYMAKSEQRIIANCRTPIEALATLQGHYFPINLAARTAVRRKMAALKHDGVGQTRKFLFEAISLFCELFYSGAIVTPSEVMETIFEKLPPDFADPLYRQLNDCTSWTLFLKIVLAFDSARVRRQNMKVYTDYMYAKLLAKEKKEEEGPPK